MKNSDAHQQPSPVQARDCCRAPRRRFRGRLLQLCFAGFLVLVIWQAPSWWQLGCLTRAQQAIAGNRWDEAQRWLERLRWRNPNSVQALICEARIARKQGRLAMARDRLLRASQAGHSPTGLQLEEWLIQAQSGDLSGSEEPLLRTLQTGQDESEICDALVQGYLRSGQYAKADLTLESWHRDFPRDWKQYFLRGLLFMQLEEWGKSSQQYREALRLNPAEPETELRLAEALLADKDADAALPLFRRCVERWPEREPIQLDLGQTLSMAGKTAEATKLLESIVSQSPESVSARLAYGRVLLTAGREADAVRVLKPAADREPHNVDVRFQLGVALRLSGHGDEAETHLRFAREARKELQGLYQLRDHATQHPQDQHSRLKLATVLFKYGYDSEALVWLQGILAMQPQHADAHRLLAEYYEKKTHSDANFAAIAAEHRRLANHSAVRE